MTYSATKPKNAKVRPVRLFELVCPWCDEAIEGTSGSLTWMPGELGAGDIIKCQSCGTLSRVPKRAA